MSWFGKKNNMQQSVCGCSCQTNKAQKLEPNQSSDKANSGPSQCLEVKVLGSGCCKCNNLADNTQAALEQLGLETTIDHVTDFSQIAAYGVMTTPALVINGKVVSGQGVVDVRSSVIAAKSHGTIVQRLGV